MSTLSYYVDNGIWTTHFSLRERIQARMLKVVVVGVASSLFDLWVICDNMKALAPLMVFLKKIGQS